MEHTTTQSQHLQAILAETSTARENLMPVLHRVNDEYGYISQDAMVEIASHFDISPTDVYGVVTFYSFFNIEKKGTFVIRLCQSISCDLTDKTQIVRALETACNTTFGNTSPDNKFTLEYTNCMGLCDQAPAMMVNKDIHASLTPEKITTIISQLKKGGA